VYAPVFATYRQLRGLPIQPAPFEHAALNHGLKGGSLQSSGLYDEVKAIFVGGAEQLERTDPARAARLLQASPHGLRHAYARTLVVDHQAAAGSAGSAGSRFGADQRWGITNRKVLYAVAKVKAS
jgi:integrase/recombinase XerC